MSPMPDFEEDNEDTITNNVNESSNFETQAQINMTNQSSDTQIENQTSNRDISENNLEIDTNISEVQILNNTDSKTTDEKSDPEKIEVDQMCDLGEREKSSIPRDSSMDTIESSQNVSNLTHINVKKCGIPLNLFTKG